MIDCPIARAMLLRIDLIWLLASSFFVLQSSLFDFSDFRNLDGAGRAEVQKSCDESEVAGWSNE